MAAAGILKLSFLLTLISFVAGAIPPSCNRFECPGYTVVETGNGYEIRSYNSPVWIATNPIQDVPLVQATQTGFLQLFDYFRGKNKFNQKIQMTAPVIVDFLPTAGPVAKAGDGAKTKYTVAQYNAPFETSGRVNEIWFPFQI